MRDLEQCPLCVLRLSDEEWSDLEESRRRGERFSLTFPHKTARNAQRDGLAIVAIGPAGRQLRIGLVRSIAATATLASRVLFDLVQSVEPDSLLELLRRAVSSYTKRASERLQQEPGPLTKVSPTLAAQMIRVLSDEPDNAAALQRITSNINQPRRFDDARALQADALSLAIKAFGGSEEAVEVSLPGGDGALGTVRLHEDAVIEHDARWIPGFKLDASDLTGRAVFRRHNDQLEVFTANKRPLEELFGVDLIYLNAARGSLVMVQYKMMEPSEPKEVSDDEREWTVAIDDQFQDERRRMHRFHKDLSPDASYRLNPGVFYFKLVRRHADANSSGLILSLEHFDDLLKAGALKGPKGGLRISYRKLDGHYLRSDPFVELIRSGYIGSRGATTAHLQRLIDAALIGGRAVVAAVQTSLNAATR